ncbi:MAG: hypothetical protein PHF20_08910 [Halothiobacillaceae bacterium]|nr:hypothetical protein [Halothiobacillaceae bacterium]
MTPEEEKKILATSPIGTWVILAIYSVLFTLGWLGMYALFVSHGPVS